MRKHFLLSLCLAVTLTACSNDKGDKKGPEGKETGSSTPVKTSSPPSQSLHVVDAGGNPIANAQILIGKAQGQPFGDNFIQADTTGSFQAPADWTDAEPVTVSADGFIRATFLAQAPNGQSFKLHPVQGSGNFQLSGNTAGFNVVNGDNLVDVGIVAPALQRMDFFSFDIWSFLSTQTDAISILGQTINLPSNLVLPNQTESYYFVKINVNKPTYRSFFRTTGTKSMVALHGRFPLAAMINGIQNKQDFTKLINIVNIQGGSFMNVNVNGDTTQDMDVTGMSFQSSSQVNTPAFDAANDFVLGVALSKSDGVYFPTDVKNLTSGQTQSLVQGPGETQLLTVIKHTSESQMSNSRDRLSATMLPFRGSVSPDLLPMMADPTLVSADHLQVAAPTALPDVTPTGTYANLQTMQSVTNPNGTLEVGTTIWEVYGPGWQSDISLPEWPTLRPGDVSTSDTGTKMHWGVTLVGQSGNVDPNVVVGPDLLESATHATHSSVDF